MGDFQRVYSDEQRDAVAHALLDLKIKPAQRVSDLAAAGLLELDGHQVPAFKMPASSVRDQARKARRRRETTLVAGITDVAHRDAVESFRVRMGAMIEREMSKVERLQKQGRSPDAEHGRKLARWLREYAALPERNQPRPDAPGTGQKNATGKPEDPRPQGLATDLLRDIRGNGTAHRAQPESAPRENPKQDTTETTHAQPQAAHAHKDNQHNNEAEPGSRVLIDQSEQEGGADTRPHALTAHRT